MPHFDPLLNGFTQDEVDDQRSELETLKTKVEELKLDANKKNEMIGVSGKYEIKARDIIILPGKRLCAGNQSYIYCQVKGYVQVIKAIYTVRLKVMCR
jgi:hypothetical protein